MDTKKSKGVIITMGMAMALGSAVMQTYSQNKALIAQGRANVQTARNLITSMNYSLQNYEQSRQDAYEAVIADLERIKLQGSRLATSVDASVNEGMMGGGRTANLIKRASRADVNRATGSAKANYEKQMNEIDLNKEAVLFNTKAQLSSIQQIKKPNLLSTLFTLGANYLGAKQGMESIGLIRQNAGVSTAQDTFDNLYGSDFLGNPSQHYSFGDSDYLTNGILKYYKADVTIGGAY